MVRGACHLSLKLIFVEVYCRDSCWSMKLIIKGDHFLQSLQSQVVVEGKSWLHEIDFGVSRKSLLSELGIHHAKVIIKVDFRQSLLSNVVIGAYNWSSKLVMQRWSFEFVVKGSCQSLESVVEVRCVKVVVKVDSWSVTMIILNGGSPIKNIEQMGELYTNSAPHM